MRAYVLGMELNEAMRTTAATREYTDQPIADDVLYRILDSARFAPSGGNTQPWRVMVVRDPSLRLQLKAWVGEVWTEYVAQRVAGHRPFSVGPDGKFHGHPIDLAEARKHPVGGPLVEGMETIPALLVVAVHLPSLAMMDIELDREHIVGGATVYPFCQNILLAARNEGIGGVLTTFLVRKEVEAKPLFGLPQEYALAAMIGLGYPQKQVTKLTRRPVESFTTIDRFDGPAFPVPNR